jgi:23S rRNA (cytosine1962-C5)-methyltransferase
MAHFPKIILKQGKEAAVRRRHPWIFSGAVQRSEGGPVEGDIAEVYSHAGEYLATGHFSAGSIVLKIFSFEQTNASQRFWTDRISKAHDLRHKAWLTDTHMTNAYRLVFSEGDELPGLIIDWYNGVAVIQAHSMGMHRITPLIIEALQEIYGEKLKAVYEKSYETLLKSKKDEGRRNLRPHTHHPLTTDHHPLTTDHHPLTTDHHPLTTDHHPPPTNHFLLGTSGPAEIAETGHRFMVDFVRGQKTGFFLDQRSNRMFAQFYARNRKVLNTFAYSGAFSVYCLKGGARHVHSVDASALALDWTKENMELNGIDKPRHSEEAADVKNFLKYGKETYSMIILDPPAFAKSHQVTNNALHAYIHLNAAALRRLEPGGLLFTFSCSQAISREVFRSAIQSAAIETGRSVKILHHLSQGPDHPVSITHPEGEYLKGLILEVE